MPTADISPADLLSPTEGQAAQDRPEGLPFAAPSASEGAEESAAHRKYPDAPRVDPPEKGGAIPENTPGLVTVASPCIFQTGDADFHAHRDTKIKFEQWMRHVLTHEDGRAMRDKRFRYRELNTFLRRKAVDARNLFWRKEPKAADLDITTILKADKKSMMRKMVAFAGKVPATIGESLSARNDLERMVDQIEWEASRKGGK